MGDDGTPSGPCGGPDRAPRFVEGPLIAHGGAAEIRALRDGELGRDLALKRLAERAAFSREMHDRFVAEARVTARLDHPSIVPVHDFGIGDDGRPWFTMKRIEGVTFEEAVRRIAAGDPQWSVARGIDAIRRVCEAIAFAHSRGVLHRDIKSANVMVGPYGEVYVMDWGLAKVRDGADLAPSAGDDDPPAGATRHGTVLGTPAYMPPEQARGDIASVDERSDVYAIGAMLHELLSLRAPYAEYANDGSRAVLAAVLAGPPAPLPSGTPRELAAVCRKAMAREPSARYASVADLRADLDAYVEGRSVAACPERPVARLARRLRRNRPLAMALAAVAVLAIAAPAVLWVQATRGASQLEAERDKERAARESADGARLVAIAQWQIDTDPGLAMALAIEGARTAPRDVADSGLYAAYLGLRERRTIEGLGSRVNSVRLADGGSRVAGFADDGSARLWDVADGTCVAVLGDAQRPVTADAASPDGGRIVTGDAAGRVSAWDARTGAPLVSWTVPARVTAIAVRADGAVVAGCADGSLHLVGPGPADVRALGPACGVAVSSVACRASAATHDTRIATLDESGAVRLFGGDGAMIATRDADPTLAGGAPPPRDRGAVVILADGRVAAWRAERGAIVCAALRLDTEWSLPPGSVAGPPSVDASGRLASIVTGRPGGAWSVVELRPSGRTDVPLAEPLYVSAATTSPAGDWRVLVCEMARLPPLATHASGVAASLVGHRYRATCADVRDDGFVVTGSGDRTVRLWDAPGAWRPLLRTGRDGAVVDTGGLRASREADRSALAFDVSPAGPVDAYRGAVHAGADATLVATLEPEEFIVEVQESRSGVVRPLWRSVVRPLIESPAEANWIQLSPDSSRLAVASRSRFAVVESRTGATVCAGPVRANDQGPVSWSADGASVFSADLGRGTASEWDATTGRRIREYAGAHTWWVVDARPSPDGRFLATTGSDGRIVLWDRFAATPLRTLADNFQGDASLEFSPDGRTLVYRGGFGPALLLDAATFDVLARIPVEGPARAIFSADGAWIHLRGSGRLGIARVPADIRTAAAAVRPRALTQAERERFGVR